MSGTLIVVQPTPFCNINCSYCYLTNRNSKAKLPLSVLEKIISSVFESDLLSAPLDIVYHAGEPLSIGKEFYRNAFELVNFYSSQYKKSFSQFIQTNAILIDSEWAKIFVEHNINLGVSIDGPDFIHDRNRVTRGGKPTHAKVLSGIQLLQKSGVSVSAIMVLTAFALDYPDEVYSFFVSNGIRSVGFNIDEFSANKSDSSYNNNQIMQKYVDFMRRMLFLCESNKGELAVREFQQMSTSLVNLSRGVSKFNNGTSTPFRILTFDINGNYSTFCPELSGVDSEKYKNFIMGNIFEQPVENMPSNPVFQLVHSEIASGILKCREQCDYWDFCGGGTPSNKFYELGTFDTTETLQCKTHVQLLSQVFLDYLQAKI